MVSFRRQYKLQEEQQTESFIRGDSKQPTKSTPGIITLKQAAPNLSFQESLNN